MTIMLSDTSLFCRRLRGVSNFKKCVSEIGCAVLLDRVLACSLYSLTALHVRLSPAVPSLVWESAAAPCRDPARDCIHTPQLGFTLGGIHRCCEVWSLVASCWKCWHIQAACPHMQQFQHWEWPAFKELAQLGPDPLDSLQGDPTV